MKAIVVDDEATIARGVSTLLSRSEITFTNITEANNGKVTLNLIKQKKPDLIITDIRMPVMDGLQLSKEVQELYPEIIVVILSGYADFKYAQQAMKYGVVDYLLKPVTQENLNKTLLKITKGKSHKWKEDTNLVRSMKGTINTLVKHVLAEERNETQKLICEWKERCLYNDLSLLEIKQLMGYFYLAYKSEFLLYYPDFIEVEALDESAKSVEQLFNNWFAFLHDQITEISKHRTPRNKQIVDEIIKEIQFSYGNTYLNIHYLAKEAGVSSSYLSKIFREVQFQPLTQYISEYRLEKVKIELEQDKTTNIGIIAEECGFNDYPYFSKIFKKRYGISPMEYREKIIY